MPEGDTIHRAARRLTAALAHQPLRDVFSTVPAVASGRLVGHAIERVEARGKNLLMHFDDGRVLYTHMRMTGSWHVYRERDRWRKPPRWAKVILHTDALMAVCFNAPVVELLSPLGLERHRFLSGLGPDLLDPDFDWSMVAARLKRIPSIGAVPLGELLLNQQVACGVGNVYKSETLFLSAQDPFVATSSLSSQRLREIYERAQKLMRQNMGGGMRDTRRRDGGRYWVYGRSGQRCRKCDTVIAMRRQGASGRSTYFCRSCQSVGRDGSTTTCSRP